MPKVHHSKTAISPAAEVAMKKHDQIHQIGKITFNLKNTLGTKHGHCLLSKISEDIGIVTIQYASSVNDYIIE
jgi:hypothetical protein